MPISVRLPPRVEQKLAEYCASHKVSRSEAVKQALDRLLETCFLLSSAGKAELLDWAQRGGITVIETPVESYPEIAAILLRYADRDIDLADAALIWLANASGQHRVLTVDERDFSAYRLKQS